MHLDLNDSLLLWSEPGVESEPFMFELISNNKKVLLFVSDKKPATLVKEAESYGFDLKSVKLVDLHEPILKGKIKGLKARVKNLIKKSGDA